jgi:hypothetical protein
MSEENTKAVEGNSETNPNTEVSKNNESIPYSRFQEVNSAKKDLAEENNQLKEKLNAIDAENKAKREERLKKNEEYTTLLTEKDAEIEELSGYKNKWNDYEATRRESLTSRLPENKQKFASNMSLSDLEEFVEMEVQVKGTGMNSSRQGVVKQAGTTPAEFNQISSEDKKNNWGTVLSDFKQRSIDKGTYKKR